MRLVDGLHGADAVQDSGVSANAKIGDKLVADVEGAPRALYIVGESKGSWHLGPEKDRADNISFKVRKTDGLERAPRSQAPLRFMTENEYTDRRWLDAMRNAIHRQCATLPFSSRLSEMTICGLAKDLGVFTPKPTNALYAVDGAPLSRDELETDHDEGDEP